MVKTFGSIDALEPTNLLVIFNITIIVVILVELSLSKLKSWAEKNNYVGLYDVLVKELLQLGIISFILFLLDATGTTTSHHEYLEAFDFTHVIILFIAFAFIIQAAFLVEYAAHASTDYLRIVRTDMNEILEEFDSFKDAASPFGLFLFYHTSVWLNVAPTIRLDMENKILERLFLTSHRFPSDFNSAKYMSKLFRSYICKLGSISKLSWATLFVLTIVNFFRVEVIDPHLGDYAFCAAANSTNATAQIYWNSANTSHLNTVNTSLLDYGNLSNTLYTEDRFLRAISSVSGMMGRRRLTSALSCPRGILIYGFLLAMLLTLLISVNYYFATYYYGVLIIRAVESSGLDWKTNGRHSFEVLLRMKSSSGDDEADVHDVKLLEQEHDKELRQQQHESVLSSQRFAQFKIDFKDLSSFATKKKSRSQKNVNRDFHDIFWFSSPQLFFASVRNALFLQCVFLSIAFTQLLPLSLEDSSVTVLWWFAYLVPILFNFQLIKLTLHKVVQLQSIIQLDKFIFKSVCLETAAEKEVLLTFATRFRRKLLEQNIGKSDWVTKIRRVFTEFDKDNSGHLSKIEFLVLLGAFDVYMMDANFNLFWERLDFDMSGHISWDELVILICPDMKPILPALRTLSDRFRKEVTDALNRSKFSSSGALPTTWEESLQKVFNSMDRGRTGSISKASLSEKLALYDIALASASVDLLMSAIVRGDAEQPVDSVSWDAFKAFVFPEYVTIGEGLDSALVENGSAIGGGGDKATFSTARTNTSENSGNQFHSATDQRVAMIIKADVDTQSADVTIASSLSYCIATSNATVGLVGQVLGTLAPLHRDV